jgi:ATP-dependent DNA helicase RecQ
MPLSSSQALTSCTHVLQSVFGYPAFRGPQAEIVALVSQGGDALVLMPTGGGKSLCYQIPAIARQQAGLGVSIVVSPLIALMHDQVGALREAGVAAAYLNSSLDFDAAQAVERDLMSGGLTLLYVAPERLTTPRFMALLDRLHAQRLLSLIAIDEAHCVSQWGHDFRPEYRALQALSTRFEGVPRVALTATADAITREDMVTQLALEGAQRFVSSFDRPNIRYTIVEKRDATAQLLRFIRDEHSDESGHDAGIVYCQSRRRVEEVAAQLCREGLTALPYHAGLDAAVRREHQDRFLREEQVIVVATIAFGMGIDKPNVRFVAHLDMPKNMEGYYQETGRCARDGEPGNAWMVYGLQDVVNQRRMIDDSPAGEDFKQVMRGKLDALLALAESAHCRRVRILGYFGQDSQPCGNCDNCLNPPAQFDATEAARKLLSCIYRVQQSSGMAFGAGHLMDILRGKRTEKVTQYQHDQLSTFGIGSDWSETQWRALLRQLIAQEAISVDAAHFNTLRLDTHAKPLLKGEVQVWMKEVSAAKRSSKQGDAKREAAHAELTTPQARAVYDALKAWRGEVAREHGLPAYVIFHDATLRAIAQDPPHNATDLLHFSGMGEKKRDAYGHEVLRVVRDAAAAVLS